MSGEEIQKELDRLETSRTLMKEGLLMRQRAADEVLTNIRSSVLTMQKTVQDIVEPINGKRTTRHSART